MNFISEHPIIYTLLILFVAWLPWVILFFDYRNTQTACKYREDYNGAQIEALRKELSDLHQKFGTLTGKIAMSDMRVEKMQVFEQTASKNFELMKCLYNELRVGLNELITPAIPIPAIKKKKVKK